MKKVLVSLVLVIFVLFAAVVLERNSLAKRAIEKGFSKFLGQQISIGSVNIGLSDTSFRIKAIKINNPSGYKENLLVEIPEIYVDYTLTDIIKGFFHFPEIKLYINEINVERDKNNTLNIEHFIPKSEKETTVGKPQDAAKKQILINNLDLKIGTIRYKDNNAIAPMDKTFNVNIAKQFTGITDGKAIADAVIAEIIKILLAEGVKIAMDSYLQYDGLKKYLKEGDTKKIEEKGKEIINKVSDKAGEIKKEGEQKLGQLQQSTGNSSKTNEGATQSFEEQAKKFLQSKDNAN